MRLVLGVQCVREALRAHGAKVDRVMIERTDSPTLLALGRFAEAQGARVETVPRAMLDKLAGETRHQGAGAYAPPLTIGAIEDVMKEERPLVVALDEVQDPHNFGAIVRSAVAFANAAILWPENASAPLTPATFRASSGAIEHARLIRVSSLRASLGWCAAQGATVVGLDGNADVELADVDLTGPTVLVVGSEGMGMRKSVRSVTTVVAKLPMAGTLDSLNASVAAATAIYEATRQRQIISKT